MSGRWFEIASVRLEVQAPAADFIDEAVASWAPFGTAASPRAWRLRVSFEDSFRTGVPAEEQVLPPTSRESGQVLVEGPNFRLTLDLEKRTAALVQARSRFAFETAVKMVLAEGLASLGGFFVHGVALAHQGRAALFTGHSGAGKSTLGSFGVEGGLTRLADELVGVVPSGEGYRVCGSPWNVGVPADAALCVLGRLGWGTPALRAVPASEMLRLLLPNTLLMDGTAAGRQRRFREVSALMERVSIRELWFAQDDSFARVLRSALETWGD